MYVEELSGVPSTQKGVQWGKGQREETGVTGERRQKCQKKENTGRH